MYCSQCGTELPNDSTFCHKCGARVIGVDTERAKTNAAPSRSEPRVESAQSSTGEGEGARGTSTIKQRAERVFWVLVCTFLLGIGLLIAGAAVADRLLPAEIHHTPDGLCDVSNEPADYVVEDEQGNVIAELTLWNTVLYYLRESGGGDPNVVLKVPLEIRLLAYGPFFGSAFLITIIGFSLADSICRQKQGRDARRG